MYFKIFKAWVGSLAYDFGLNLDWLTAVTQKSEWFIFLQGDNQSLGQIKVKLQKVGL